MAALLAAQLSAKLPGAADAAPQAEGEVAVLPAFLHAPFASAMSQAMLLPAFVALFGVIAALFLLGSLDAPQAPAPQSPRAADDDDDDLYWADGEDEYFEYEVTWDATDTDAGPHEPAPAPHNALLDTDVLDPVTEPLPDGAAPPRSEPAEWRSILDQLMDEPAAPAASNGFTHNGFAVQDESGSRGRHSRD